MYCVYSPHVLSVFTPCIVCIHPMYCIYSPHVLSIFTLCIMCIHPMYCVYSPHLACVFNRVLRVFAVEADNDLLTCGRCGQEFYLCDINSFIKHKIRLCTKNSLNCRPDGENHGNEGSPPPSLPPRPPDQGGLHVEKGTLSGINFQALFSSKDSLERIIREELSRTETCHSKRRDAEMVDAETITVYSGKSRAPPTHFPHK